MPAAQRRFLILHGVQNRRPRDHWQHHLAENLRERGEIVLYPQLPDPASPSILWPEISDFATGAVDVQRFSNSSRGRVRLVCSDNDPYCPEGAAEAYGAPLDLDVDLLSGAGHLSTSDGYGNWPRALRWCLDPAARLAPTGT